MPPRASLKTIEARIRELEAKAQALRMAEKPGIAQLKAVVAKYRLSRADVLAVLGKGAATGKLRGKKVKPKYRNPGNKNETWAGRGLRPRWLTAALKQGKKLEDFAI